MMEVVKTGFILYTLNYDKCVAFYHKILDLKILYKKENLTCFDFYGSYLMVELDDEAEWTSTSVPVRDRTCIRLNVNDVKNACANLDENSIPYKYHEYNWGTIAKFRDPDGNLIGFRSGKEHIVDIKEGIK